MTISPAKEGRAPLDAVLLFVTTGVLALGALLATAFTADPLFRLQGWIFVAAAVLALSDAALATRLDEFRARQTAAVAEEPVDGA